MEEHNDLFIQDLNQFIEMWPAVLTRMKQQIGVTALVYLQDASPVELNDSEAVLEFQREFHYEKACDAAKRLPFAQVLNDCMAAPRNILFRLAKKPTTRQDITNVFRPQEIFMVYPVDEQPIEIDNPWKQEFARVFEPHETIEKRYAKENSMARDGEDVTNLIERLEAFEERLGVRLEALFAYIQIYSNPLYEVHVNGELHPHEGVKLKKNVEIVVSAYDSLGRVIGTNDVRLDSDSFYGFETFSIEVQIPSPNVEKIRIYPKPSSW